MKTLLFITTLLVSFSANADHQGGTNDYAKQPKLPQQKEQTQDQQAQQRAQMQQLENQRMIKELEQRRQEIEQQLSQQPK